VVRQQEAGAPLHAARALASEWPRAWNGLAGPNPIDLPSRRRWIGTPF